MTSSRLYSQGSVLEASYENDCVRVRLSVEQSYSKQENAGTQDFD
jgi:hypothetical protein